MIRYEDDDIILSGEAARTFAHDALHPDEEAAQRLNDFLRTLDGATIVRTEQGISAQIPDWEIPEKTEANELRYEVFATTNISFSMEAKSSFKKVLGKPGVSIAEYYSVSDKKRKVRYRETDSGRRGFQLQMQSSAAA